MRRKEIINKIGYDYHKENIENGEFSYQKVLGNSIKDSKHKFLDLRFEVPGYSLLVETKSGRKEFHEKDILQLQEYVSHEKKHKINNKIISILYDTDTKKIKVWKDGVELKKEITINPFAYYVDLYEKRINDRSTVLKTTNILNNLMHKFGIKEALRSQFMGCILVAINNGLIYDVKLKTSEILNRIKEILEEKIDFDENKKIKTDILIKILKEQDIKSLKINEIIELLSIVEKDLKPFINGKTDKGEDLLNLFFNTFNKYVGKKDKNQAFTPPHITEFMCSIVKLNKNSKVLDPTCGSGSFLVQSMTQMLLKAGKDSKKREEIKTKQLFGIENEKQAFGLATTNMLIHEDGKSNVVFDSLFNKENWLKEKKIDVVLMNPPFNGKKMPQGCPITKNGSDATKGLYFVERTAEAVSRGMLATILPLQCAIGSDSKVLEYKRKMLSKHTLKAVFTLPDDVFHPGANVNSCIMLFELGIPHDSSKNTYFGYYKNDGFQKKKNLGRTEKLSWQVTKKKWIETFDNLDEIPNFSVKKNIDYDDEWLAEAYMETDYSKLNLNSFKKTCREWLAYEIKTGGYDD